ncbi:MAG: hypothetical protein WD598_15140 [Acidimicrobiia bacterium]
MTTDGGLEGDHVIGVVGGDARLAEAAMAQPGASVRFVPDSTSDIARALGLTAGAGLRAPVSLDVLMVDTIGAAVNMVVLGTAPDRRRAVFRSRKCRVEVDGRVVWDNGATGVVVANGEYLRGLDVVPRGHPGDGRLEVHVYAMGSAQAKQMRARLATGTHLPHPGIHTTQGSSVTVRWDRPVRCEVDGVRGGRARTARVALAPGALTLVP